MKTIVVLGCSNSEGAELSHGLSDNYWEDILRMEDCYKNWWSNDAVPIRMKSFFSRPQSEKNEDWEYNHRHSYSRLLYEKGKNRVINAAKSGSGISYVKTLYDLNHYKFSGTDPLLSKVTESILWHYNKYCLTSDDLMGLSPLDFSRFQGREFYSDFYEKRHNSLDHYRLMEGSQPEAASLVDFSDPNLMWKDEDKNFKNLIDDCEVLIWQLTNEPRICVHHPNLPIFTWDPSPYRLKEKFVEAVETEVDYWLSKHPNITEEEIEKSKVAWKIEAENFVDNICNNIDYSQIMNDNVHFINYIIHKRKQAGKKTIIFWLFQADFERYDFGNRIDTETADDFFCFNSEITIPSTSEEIKEQILSGEFSFQRYGHLSEYSHRKLASRLKESLDMIEEKEQKEKEEKEFEEKIREERRKELEERMKKLKEEDPFIYD